MSIPKDPCQLIFKTMSGRTVSLEVDKNVTTDELISSIAIEMNASKDKIMLSLDLSLNVDGHVATQENAKDVDTKVKEQFQSNIVNFIQRSHTGTVIVRR